LDVIKRFVDVEDSRENPAAVHLYRDRRPDLRLFRSLSRSSSTTIKTRIGTTMGIDNDRDDDQDKDGM